MLSVTFTRDPRQLALSGIRVTGACMPAPPCLTCRPWPPSAAPRKPPVFSFLLKGLNCEFHLSLSWRWSRRKGERFDFLATVTSGDEITFVMRRRRRKGTTGVTSLPTLGPARHHPHSPTPLVMASSFGNRHTHGRKATQRVHLYKRHTSNTIHIRLRGDFSFPKAFTALTTSRALEADTNT